MAPNSKPAEAVAHSAGLQFLADGIAATVLIARQVGNSHDTIELRKNPTPNSKRPWLIQLNGHPRFSISERQLLSLRRFRNVAVRQLSARASDHEQWLRDVLALQEDGWRPMIEYLIAALELEPSGAE
ncbi:hypothetical protein RX327_02805 [Bradyrhizobium sp. BEA-2-5]|uniref:hypothetical protein n=1 Tax=Bradyrhizobium sp. BEA-2-5 TaxID=3080015 RepID=UPI00293EB9AC|nr:hypothetical protein [Bradyrhizobium sp. BEA-2-5]WOH82146.1 hypothetical protein RX327_02805 [Bradyrhizobium sp. BEA-2-5]